MADLHEPSPIWKLSSTLSLVEAALLLLDIEPQGLSDSIEGWHDEKKPDDYLAATNALETAISKNAIVGELHLKSDSSLSFDGLETVSNRVDYNASTVDVASLSEWLIGRGYNCSTFGSVDDHPEGFRDPNHDRYSAKLAAAVQAWEAYDENSKERGTAKQRLTKWLRLNATHFELADEKGSPMGNAIEEVARIANWVKQGGAPRQKP